MKFTPGDRIVYDFKGTYENIIYKVIRREENKYIIQWVGRDGILLRDYLTEQEEPFYHLVNDEEML